jgi:hypothetical protein
MLFPLRLLIQSTWQSERHMQGDRDMISPVNTSGEYQSHSMEENPSLLGTVPGISTRGMFQGESFMLRVGDGRGDVFSQEASFGTIFPAFYELGETGSLVVREEVGVSELQHPLCGRHHFGGRISQGRKVTGTMVWWTVIDCLSLGEEEDIIEE